MDVAGTNKTRVLVDALVLASADPTASPGFPTGPDSNRRVVFRGDMMGARIGTIRWRGTFSGFTAADLTLQHSESGEDGSWTTLKAATQVTSSPFDANLNLEDADPVPKRFIRALLDMTGSPGTSTHTVEIQYAQDGPRGALAPPGYIDRDS